MKNLYTLNIFKLKKIPGILLLLFVLTSCENDIHIVQSLGSKSTGVEEGKDIVSYLSQSGKVKAKLVAPVMLRTLLDTVKVEFPKGLHVLFYDSLTNMESDLIAKYGNYYENDNKVFLRDSVRVFNIKGDTLWCKESWLFHYLAPCVGLPGRKIQTPISPP